MVKLWLTEKSHLNEKLISCGEVEKVVNGFEGVVWQVLCFIHQQNRSEAGFVPIKEIFFKITQGIRKGTSSFDLKFVRNETQKLVSGLEVWSKGKHNFFLFVG